MTLPTTIQNSPKVRPQSKAKSKPVYILGHDDTIVRYHSAHTVHNSAAYLIPYLKPDSDVLDVGCGPGSITVGLASLCPRGHIVGVDLSDSVVAHASKIHGDVATFKQASVYELPFPDDSFDVVYANQILQFLLDVPAALREMRRVTKPGGVVGMRVSSSEKIVSRPTHHGAKVFYDVFKRGLIATGCDPEISCRIPGLASEAGFVKTMVTTSQECSTGEALKEVALMVADCVEDSPVVETWMENGVVSDEEIAEMREFVEVVNEDTNGFVIEPLIEFVCKK